MKYVSEFRDPQLAQQLAQAMAREVRPDRLYRFMEFCGGHTHALARYGVLDLLPPPVQMIHGPGCPVCVLPIGRIDMAIEVARRPGVVLASYGDTLRIPASKGLSLMGARAQGAEVRVVYSVDDALQLARTLPDREVVFLAIGFETTTPPTAVAIQTAQREGLRNFSVLCNHVLTPAAMHAILDQPEPVALDGLVGPAHVSTIIGSRPYEVFATNYRLPVVIAGFEPLDVMQAILMLIRQVNEGRAEVENEFTRAVNREGNARAIALTDEVFSLRDGFEWRGLGRIPHSALRLSDAHADMDAELRFGLAARAVPDHPRCECGPILRGHKRPQDCVLFGTICTPDQPTGACMVSSEGACAAHYRYGRHQTSEVTA
ncbi:hydrogenase formation protein HypD [Aquabacterium sp.]|uniref:hydrogenase formation protein HypD n=1 Tax=Aquabacterium sp. TaxID=1872578 RepID=UPI004037FE02